MLTSVSSQRTFMLTAHHDTPKSPLHQRHPPPPPPTPHRLKIYPK